MEMESYFERCLIACQNKLQELMPEDEFLAFVQEVARDAFRDEVEEMPACEFKDFVLDNFDEITEQI